MTWPAAAVSQRLLRGRPWWAALCGAIAIASLWVPSWTNPFTNIGAATEQLALFSLVVGSWVALGRPAQRGNGTLMAVLAVMFGATSLQYLAWGPWVFIYTMEYPVIGIVLGVLLLRWPRARLQTRVQLRVVQLAWVLVPLLVLAWCVTWDRHQQGYTAPIWWPTIVGVPDLSYWLYNVSQGLQVFLLIVLIGLMVARIVRAAKPGRRELAPVAIAAAAFAALSAAEIIVLVTSTNIASVIDALSNLSLLAVPLSFLIAAAVQRVQRALAVEALLDPGRLASVDAVGHALSRALGDRHLTLAAWSPRQDRYLLGDGTAAPDDPGGAHVVYVASPADGTPLARIGVDPKLAGQTDFVEAVLRAAGTALDNARLQAELRAGQRQARPRRRTGG